ncbi:MAG: copper resistance D family protein [Acetobacteraceae bacterium]
MAALSAAIVLLRGIHDAALLVLVGAVGFMHLPPPRLRPLLWPAISGLAFAGGTVALGAGFLWFLADAVRVAQADGIVAALQAVPAFVIYLRFAKLLLLQLALIAGAVALVRWHGPALGLACLAVLVQPWLGHPAEVSMALAAADAVHLLAASAWAGELVPLILCLFLLRPVDAVDVFQRFLTIGAVAVAALFGSGAILGLTLAGGVSGLTDSAYGRVALLKAGLFVTALALAAVNRFLLTPRLGRAHTASHTLARSVAAEAILAAAIVLAAGWLSQLPPAGLAMH